MPQIQACPLPAHSLLHAHIGPGDFLDCYAAPGTVTAREAAKTIVSFPGWVQALVRLRGLVTAPFGLKQDGPEGLEKLGPFPIQRETEDELIAGFDDKHLDFRISVLRHEGRIHLATWVHPHNLGGRLYLALILPFHILIARDGVARAVA